jgi:chemotaxis protein CheX
MARAKVKTVAESQGRKSRARKSRVKTGKVAGKRIKAGIEVAAETEAAEDHAEMLEAGAPEALVLPDSLDSASVADVKGLLIARRGAPLVVDAAQVRRVGVQALQVLIAAAQTWQADGQSYVVANPSSEFLDTIALVGLSREHLLLEGMA